MGSLLPWLHSVTWEDDYSSPWNACERAQDLAFQCGFDQQLQVRINACPCSSLKSCFLKSDRNRSELQVSFHRRVQVLIGLPDELTMFGSKVSDGKLKHMLGKPWCISDRTGMCTPPTMSISS